MSRIILSVLVVCFVLIPLLNCVNADEYNVPMDVLLYESTRSAMDDGVPSQDNHTRSPSQWWNLYSYYLSFIIFFQMGAF